MWQTHATFYAHYTENIALLTLSHLRIRTVLHFFFLVHYLGSPLYIALHVKRHVGIIGIVGGVHDS
jgi:hypothetical protein